MFTFLCTTSLLGSTVILKMTVHVPSMETCFLIPERAWQTLFLKDCVSLSDLRVTWRTDTRSWSLFFLTRASLWQKSGYTDDISQKHWKENNLFLYGAKEKNWKGFFFFFFWIRALRVSVYVGGFRKQCTCPQLESCSKKTLRRT